MPLRLVGSLRVPFSGKWKPQFVSPHPSEWKEPMWKAQSPQVGVLGQTIQSPLIALSTCLFSAGNDGMTPINHALGFLVREFLGSSRIYLQADLSQNASSDV